MSDMCGSDGAAISLGALREGVAPFQGLITMAMFKPRALPWASGFGPVGAAGVACWGVGELGSVVKNGAVFRDVGGNLRRIWAVH